MFGLIKNTLKLATDIVVTPVAILHDTVNIVNIADDSKESKTIEKLNDLSKDIEKIIDNK